MGLEAQHSFMLLYLLPGGNAIWDFVILCFDVDLSYEVKCEILQVQPHVDAQKVPVFRTFWISDLWMRDVPPAKHMQSLSKRF